MANSASLQKSHVRLLCLSWLGAILHAPPCGFGRTKQLSLSELREKTGFAMRTKAGGVDSVMSPLTSGEKRLVKNIGEAAEKRDWLVARSLFGEYTGGATQIYSATMRAAFRCQKYKEGAEIYEQCMKNCVYVGQPVFTNALRIFAKLGDDAQVQQIWSEALKTHELNDVLGTARIAAAAEAGDVEMAAATLDKMNSSNVSINVYHVTSAIRACWGWGKNQHKAAKYFFELMPQFRLSPNIVTFTTLIGAYHTASLNEVLSIYEKMKMQSIEPNGVFAETYVYTLLQTRKGKRVEEQVRNKLNESPERLQAARDALAEFQQAGLPLTTVCKGILSQLMDLGF